MYLTKNEIEIMDVLWKAGKALSRGEILSHSEDKSWMDSSVHILLNSMLKKGAIREAGFVKCGKTCGRVYEAALSCEEYYISTLDSTRTRPDPVQLLAAYIDRIGLKEEERSAMKTILDR
ncbi:MAG: BlaI/MecI/CopY family transcriptional regulator [Lachnospiraceae bacterium]|nr:BlaI/MecI/CopY family transcriptional regulator [Lachnospiraceae bacterium]